MKIEGSRILLTGASAGIGAALARRLAKQGATLGLVARRKDRLEALLDEIRVDAPDSRVWAADLGDLDQAEAIVREAEDTFGRIDGLINNAARPSRRKFTELTREELDEVMRVDFTSPVRMGMAALPAMLERGSGMILNVASMGGRLGIVGEAAYCSAKFALCGWTEVMFMELLDSGIEVKLIQPGPIDTEIWSRPEADAPHYKGPLVPADDCAAGIIDAIETEGFEFYVPDMSAIASAKAAGVEAFLRGSSQAARASS